jgi:hypothetical protein
MASLQEPRNLRREFAFGIGLWIFFAFGFVLGWVQNDRTLIFVSAAAYSYSLAVVLHELGHAWAAHALGYAVYQIKLGVSYDPETACIDFRFLGYPWKIYSPLIMAGSVRYFACRLDHYRMRSGVICAAGPAISGLAALPGLVLFESDHLSSADLVLLAWTYANALIFCFTALPSERTSRRKTYRTDGLLVLDHFQMTPETAWENATYSRFIYYTLGETAAMKARTLPEAEKHVAAHSDHPWLLFLLLEKLDLLGRAQTFLKLSSHPHSSRKFVVERLDGFLTSHLAVGKPPDDALWDQLSLKLLDLDDCLSTRGTRGSVLIDLGRISEGRVMLEDMLIKTLSKPDKAYGHIFIALAEQQQGNIEAGRKHAEMAFSFDAKCPALGRVSDLLAIPAKEPDDQNVGNHRP